MPTSTHCAQELGPEHFWVSETLFGLLFGSFVLWIVSPFYTEHKSFYTVVVLRRLLVHLVCVLPRFESASRRGLCACTRRGGSSGRGRARSQPFCLLCGE